jgi:chorismate mutase
MARMKKKKESYMVDFSILPTAVKATIRAKQMLEDGRANSIYDAVRKVGISRSAFYKYKDHVSDALDENARDVLTMTVMLQNDVTVLTRLLRKFSKEETEPITMVRTAPMGGLVALMLSFYLADLPYDSEDFIKMVRGVKGVEDVVVMGDER